MKELDIHKWVIKSLPFPIKENSSIAIADVGCGTGEISCYLSQFGKVTGFDFTLNSLSIANETAKRLDRNITFIHSDITKEEERGRFDYIFCIGVLHHIPEMEKALDNIKAMMKSDTILVISLYNWYSSFFRRKIKRFFPERDDSKGRENDSNFHVYQKFMSRKEARDLFKKHNLKVVGEFPKTLELLRLLTGRGAMMTFALKTNEKR